MFWCHFGGGLIICITSFTMSSVFDIIELRDLIMSYLPCKDVITFLSVSKEVRKDTIELLPKLVRDELALFENDVLPNLSVVSYFALYSSNVKQQLKNFFYDVITPFTDYWTGVSVYRSLMVNEFLKFPLTKKWTNEIVFDIYINSLNIAFIVDMVYFRFQEYKLIQFYELICFMSKDTRLLSYIRHTLKFIYLDLEKKNLGSSGAQIDYTGISKEQVTVLLECIDSIEWV